MQDITDLPFMRTIARFGCPDFFVTEYFRVHIYSRLDPYLLRSITENETGRPVVAQMIGRDPTELTRTVRLLLEHPVAGIDLNLGCPAPIVCRKDAGGGLLRQLDHVHRLLGELREACPDLPFTVKCRLGYHDPQEIENLVRVFEQHQLDLLTIHGRTVQERYQTPVHPDLIRYAVEALPFPVIANGNVVDIDTGQALLEQTGAAGLMIGRGAIRYPWLFSQLRAVLEEEKPTVPVGQDLLDYVLMLYEETARERVDFVEEKHVQKMKKYLVFIAQGHDPAFEHQIRRVRTYQEFSDTCSAHLSHQNPLPTLPPENSKLFCGFSDLLR